MIKINSLEVENVKRIKALKMEFSNDGLFVIGGKNKQGKTSVLDSIIWALGGDRYKPSNVKRDDSMAEPHIKLTLSNGIVVERKGKNSSLKVTDPEGNVSGQSLLNNFINELALNLPKFMGASDVEKAKMLIGAIAEGHQILELEKKEKINFDNRHSVGMIADSKLKHFEELTEYADVPDEVMSASDLIKAQQDALAQNGLNQTKRAEVQQIADAIEKTKVDIDFLDDQINKLKEEQAAKAKRRDFFQSELITAKAAAEGLLDTSTEVIEKQLTNIESTNVKIRANLEKQKAKDEADEYKAEYDLLTTVIDETRAKKLELIEGANLGLSDLTIDQGKLTYQGKNWDCLSGSDQLRIATAIARANKKECGFVLMDKLEQMDDDTLKEFGEWLEAEGLQVIATRVSTGDECSIIIDDGVVSGGKDALPEVIIPELSEQEKTPEFTPGKF